MQSWSSKSVGVLRALGAIAFVHAGKPGKYYRADLVRLAEHADEDVRSAARRAMGPAAPA